MNVITILLVSLVSFTNLCNGYIHLMDNKVTYTIALKQNNVNILQDALLDISDYKSPNYGKFWNKTEILDVLIPDYTKVKDITDWLDDYNTEYYNYGDALLCKNTINEIEDMYNMKIVMLNNIFVASDNYYIPDKFKDTIEFIEGLSNNKYTRQKLKSINTNVNVDPGYAGREVINKLYNITWNKIKTNSSSGSIEYQGGSGFSPSDLLLSQKSNNENVKIVSKNHIIGNDESSDLESQLDMQMMSQTSENVSLWFWDDNQWLYSFAVNFFNHSEIPDVISMSWGWSESDQCSIAQCNNETAQQYINRVNVEYIKIGLRGVTITVSSGDAGAPGRTSEVCSVDNPVNPVFPGSSPWITSVGGTFVLNSSNVNKWTSPLCKQYGCLNGNQEMNTNFEYVGWTAGGGFAFYSSEKQPKWQSKFVNDYLHSGVPLPSKFNDKGRGYPDVSAIAHNCPVFSSGSIMDVDGTSCSSPLFAGIVSLLNDYQITHGKSKLGFINPILYQMVSDDPSIFTDYTEGNNWCTEQMCCPTNKDGGSNFGYKAAKGWDPVYGLGTPNVGKMIDWLSKNT
jgi:subtilase family serine protease